MEAVDSVDRHIQRWAASHYGGKWKDRVNIIVAAVVFLPQGVVRCSADAWRERRLGLLDTVRAYRL